MKIVVIGSTGVIGAAVVRALSARHEVIGVHRHGEPRVDIMDTASIASLFAKISGIDAVVCCAGGARFKPLLELADDDFQASMQDKLMGQVNVIRQGLTKLREGGSITVTSGVLAQKPMQGGAAISMVNSGLEGFVRGAAFEAPRKLRVNVVSPPWVTETLQKLGMDPSWGLPADTVARTYVAAVEGSQTGETLAATA